MPQKAVEYIETRRTVNLDAKPLFGASEMGRRIASHEWSRSPLGLIHTWSASLRTTAAMMLQNRFPMSLWWGRDLVMLYNDSYAPVMGGKHPAGLGRPASEVWSEIWHILGPQTEVVLSGKGATWNEHLFLPMNRKGFVEETYFTFSYSPVPDDGGEFGGLLVTCQETTTQVQDDRQLRTLRDLAARSAEAKSAEEACTTAAAILAANDADAPFVLLYLTDGNDQRLASSAGFDPTASPVGREAAKWPLDEAARAGAPFIVNDLVRRVGPMPGGRWGDAPARAIVVPLVRTGLERPYGFLVAGVSPRRPLDERYEGFFRLVGDQIATTIANARAYEEEKQRAEKLAEIDRAKTAFFSNVSHEFRTPLTLMLGPTEDALSGHAALGGEELRAVHRNELRLLKLVNALLDFSRMEAGRAQASFEATDLAALTCDLASTFRSAVERAGLRFRLECSSDEPIYVDRTMWEKVVFNLLSNALKFTFEGEIAIRLTPTDDGVALTVSDTGTGIPAHELPRMFERFHRIEGQRGRTHEGSGIGLALMSEIVALHGGTVSVDSTAGKGSTFTVRLKRGTAHLPQDRIGASSSLTSTATRAEAYLEEAMRWLPGSSETFTPSTTTVEAPPLADATAGARVILADDNADMRDYVGRLLAQRWRVETVVNGAAALEAARRERPDLILTDVMMPVLDGFGLLREVRADSDLRLIPVVLLSARAGEESRIEGLEAGADDYLVKPFSARELIARVATHLELARLRRTAESHRAKLHKLIMDAPVAIALLRGPDHVFEFANPTYCAMVGRDNLVGKTVAQAFPELPPDASNFDVLNGVYRTGRDFTANEFVSAPLDKNKKGAEESLFRLLVTPTRDLAGVIDGLMVVAVDITLQVQAKRQSEEARLAAEGANRAKDEFLAMLGHELRNPLAPILTALQLLRLRSNDKTLKEFEIIERQVRHMVRLVDDLLDVSRITRGHVKLTKAPVAVAEVAAKAIEMVGPLLERARHELVVSVPRRGLAINADPARIAQVLANLLTNAAKYTPAGGRIALDARREGDEVVIAVRDNGVGIPSDLLPKVFDLFVQNRQTIDRSQGGLGLGLSIVESLVQLHGGSVSAESEGPARGSTFTIRLPAIEDPPVAVDEMQFNVAVPAASGRRVLIVDDNVDAAEILAESLRMLGYNPRMATDGPSALEVSRVFRPEVAILDIGLPVMDGYELAGRLRAQLDGAELRLIALTGYGQDADRNRSFAAGFDEHFVKPVDLDELTTALEAQRPQDASFRTKVPDPNTQI